jgi:hypothetical protein
MDEQKVIPIGAPAEVLGRRIGKLVGRRRMDVILDKENAPALVRALPAEDLYFLVKDVGLDDAAPLVGLASPEQFVGFVDLDCWRPGEEGRTLDPRRVLQWLAVAREGGSAEGAALKRATLDLEILEIVLHSGLRIVDRKAVDEDGWARGAPGEDPEAEWKETPCGSWLVAFEIDGAEGIELRRILDELYADNPFEASRFLSAIRSELSSELTEHALRFRDGRLEDMGFPPPELAASLYAKTDPSQPPPARPEPIEAVPGFFLAEFTGASFLDRCAAGVTGVAARTDLDRALMYLANTVLVADRVAADDPDDVREAVGRMRAYLNLGLHHLAGGDPARGTALLGSASLRHVFQVGFTLTLERRWRAERLAATLPEPAGQRPLAHLATLLDPPEGAVVAALVAYRPLHALALDAALEAGWPGSPGALEAAEAAPPVQPPAGTRPFAVPEDLAAADAALERAEALVAVAAAAELLVLPEPSPEAEGEVPTLTVRVLTAILQLAGGGAFTPAALTAEALADAVAAARSETGGLRPDLADSARARLTAAEPDHPAAASALVAMASARFEAAFGRVEGAPDPRFVDAVRVLKPA